ncbi:MAG: polyphosphate polymerase domain-containing protein [Oscillospiraceae bacterium]|nr:polyphosphate polymerase domain-containing protein [Oscillospiraceae bacterium]
MDRTVNRHEVKFIINLLEAELLKRRLPALLKPDSHARADGSYFIRSVYFDDPDYTAYREKLDGVKERTKYRIRFYNMSDKVIFLEKKMKNGDMTGKESVRLSRRGAQAFLDGHRALPKLPGLAGELGRLRQGVWKPVVIVDYDRWAYTYDVGNVRVTIDMNVRTAPFATDAFDKRLLTVPVLEPGQAVLEVKYDAFLPAPVRELLMGVTKQRCAVSKYTQCLSILE